MCRDNLLKQADRQVQVLILVEVLTLVQVLALLHVVALVQVLALALVLALMAQRHEAKLSQNEWNWTSVRTEVEVGRAMSGGSQSGV